MPTRPKHQHYVTRAYLEGFLDPGEQHLFCYGRRRSSPFRSQPSELANERNYYSFRRTNGTWDDSLEHTIEEVAEGPGLEVIRMLSSGKTRLDWLKRNALAMLMAVQRFRVPHLRQILDSVQAEMVRKLLTEYNRKEKERGPGRLWMKAVSPIRSETETGPPAYITRETLEGMQQSLQSDPSQFSRNTLIELAVSFAKVFRRMKWTVHYSKRGAFITSDCPTLLRHERTDVQHAGIIRPDTHIEFPLSRTSLLSMTHDFALLHYLDGLPPNAARQALSRVPEIAVAQADEAQVHEFNLRQAQYCSRWSFSGGREDWLIPALNENSRNVRHRVVQEGDMFKFETLSGAC